MCGGGGGGCVYSGMGSKHLIISLISSCGRNGKRSWSMFCVGGGF